MIIIFFLRSIKKYDFEKVRQPLSGRHIHMADRKSIAFFFFFLPRHFHILESESEIVLVHKFCHGWTTLLGAAATTEMLCC